MAVAADGATATSSAAEADGTRDHGQPLDTIAKTFQLHGLTGFFAAAQGAFVKMSLVVFFGSIDNGMMSRTT